MGTNKEILNKLYPVVEKSLSVKSNENVLLSTIGKYVDRNMKLLSASGPCYRIQINDADKNGVYEAIGLDEIKIKQAFKDSTYINASWAIMGNPFFTACALCVRYYIIKNKQDKVDLLSFYLCMGMYPLLHYKFFKHNCNENIMNYTISTLSNKYKYKQLKSCYNTLKDLASTCTSTHKDRLKVGGDSEFTKYVNDMHARLNDNLKNVAISYYKNHESGNYLNVDSESMDEDNYREVDNNSFVVDRVLNKIITKVAMNGPNFNTVSLSAKLCNVSLNELKNLSLIVTNEYNMEDYKNITEAILQIYLFDMKRMPEQIKSKDYITSVLQIYKRTNNKDENLNTIRRILDKWVDENGVKKRIKRQATLNNFKRSMFIFVALTIQDNV